MTGGHSLSSGELSVAEAPAVRGHDVRARRLAFSAILLATLLSALDQSIVATALPRIVGDLGGFGSLSWTVSAYLLASTVSIPIYGKLSDLYGRRLLFIVAISIFLVGSALCGLAETMGQLIAFRAVQGLGAGGLIPLAQAAIGDLYSPRERGRYQGYVSSMWGIAAISGPLVGGTLTQAVSWRWIFYVNIPIGIVALAVIAKTFEATGRRRHKIDYAGAVTLGFSLAAIMLATTWSATAAFTSAKVLGALALGLIALVAFARIELRASEPIFPLQLVGNRVFTAATGGFFVLGACIFGIAIYMPIYFQSVRGYTPTASGLMMVSYLLSWVASAFMTGRLITRIGRYRMFPIIGAVLTTVGTGLLLFLNQTTPPALIALALAIAGWGMGCMAPAYLVAAQNSIDGTMLGAASGAMNVVRAIGGGLAVSVLGAVLASRTKAILEQQGSDHGHGAGISRLVSGLMAGEGRHSDDVHVALVGGLHSVFLISTAVAACGLLCALSLKDRPLREGR